MLENAVLRPQQVIGLFPASRVWSLPVGRGGPSNPGDAQPVAGSTAKLPWKPGSTRSTRRKTRAGGFTPESGSRGGAVLTTPSRAVNEHEGQAGPTGK